MDRFSQFEVQRHAARGELTGIVGRTASRADYGLEAAGYTDKGWLQSGDENRGALLLTLNLPVLKRVQRGEGVQRGLAQAYDFEVYHPIKTTERTGLQPARSPDRGRDHRDFDGGALCIVQRGVCGDANAAS